MITQEYVHKRFIYEPISGSLKWRALEITGANIKTFNTKYANKEVGTISGHGHKQTHLDGDTYYIHRLIWLYVYGSWPENTIDHINGIKTDNRLENLRDVTQAVNIQAHWRGN